MHTSFRLVLTEAEIIGNMETVPLYIPHSHWPLTCSINSTIQLVQVHTSGLCWFILVSNSLQWSLLVSTGLQCTLVSSILYWFPVVFTGLQWSLLVSTPSNLPHMYLFSYTPCPHNHTTSSLTYTSVQMRIAL